MRLILDRNFDHLDGYFASKSMVEISSKFDAKIAFINPAIENMSDVIRTIAMVTGILCIPNDVK